MGVVGGDSINASINGLTIRTHVKLMIGSRCMQMLQGGKMQCCPPALPDPMLSSSLEELWMLCSIAEHHG